MHRAALDYAKSKRIRGAEALLTALVSAWSEKDEKTQLDALEVLEDELPESLRGQAWNIRGLLLGNMAQWDEAIAYHQKALATPGFDTPGYAYNNIGIAYGAKGDHDTAIEWHQKALADPSYDTPGSAYNNIGVAYGAKGDHDTAIEWFQKALADPSYDTPGRAYNNIGNSYQAKGDFDRAIEFYQKAIDTPGYDTPGIAYHNMGNAHGRKGEHDRAIERYRKALETLRNPIRHAALINISNSLRHLGRLDEALETVNQILNEPEIDGNHWRAALIKQIIEEAKAGVQPSVAEEAVAKAPARETAETPEQIMLRKLGLQEKGRKDKYDEYLTKEVPARMDGFTCLRGWSSAVTLLEGGDDCHWTGGGYFLKWHGKGIVIDPGFDFMDNFHDAKLHLKEVDAVLVSHNHSDHNYDLSSLDDLRYELHRRWKVLNPKDRKKHDVSRCLFVIDEDTSKTFRDDNADHRGLPMKFSEADAQRERWLERLNELPLTIEHFKVQHGSDVPHAMGMRLRLHDGKNGTDFIFGYTGDTRWHPPLKDELANCDVLLAHISMPSDEELLDDSEYSARLGKEKGAGGFEVLPSDGFKATHLGYRGIIELIVATQPKMVLVGEFWAGLADLRVDLVKGIRRKVLERTGKDIPILPTGLGFRLLMPSLEVLCTSCERSVPHGDLKIAPAANPFGPLSYLCPGCLG